MKRKINKFVSLLSAAVLLFSLLTPAALAAGDAVYLRTAEDLAEFSRSCTLDSWSQGKTVYLEADIDLTGVDYNNSGDGTRQLCEDVYRNSLKKLSDGNDDFGRPSTRWTYKNDSVTAPKAPEVSYTAAVEGGDIYVDLGRVNPDTIVYVVDGDDTAGEWKWFTFFNVYMSSRLRPPVRETKALVLPENISTLTSTAGANWKLLEFPPPR